MALRQFSPELPPNASLINILYHMRPEMASLPLFLGIYPPQQSLFHRLVLRHRNQKIVVSTILTRLDMNRISEYKFTNNLPGSFSLFNRAKSINRKF